MPLATREAPFAFRHFEEGEFWRGMPAYRDMGPEAFLDPGWQARNTVHSVERLRTVMGPLVGEGFLRDVAAGLAQAPMALRVTPYLMALVDWSDPGRDPIRRQFIPLASEWRPDHASVELDSLGEMNDSPVPGLTRRYPDKALFLALNTCPVYCRFCTRSYAVGLDTEVVRKTDLRQNRDRWETAFQWLAANPEVEDVVISGGDAYNLSPAAMRHIGERLLSIDSIRRVRLATKGIAVLPSRIGRDAAWTDALLSMVRLGRQRGISVAVHTHFNHPREVTWVTRDAAELLFREGVTVRNQSVLLKGVNDDAATMGTLIRRLGHLHIQPYYVFLLDVVPGVMALRTSLAAAIRLEKEVRGITAGFNHPRFVIDLPGGGGKRDVHSFESYDTRTGISVFRSPAIHPTRQYVYRDPMPDDSEAAVLPAAPVASYDLAAC